MALPPVAALNSTIPATSSEGTVRVKEERPDEDEIVQLAAKLVEANKAKMAAAQAAAVAAAAPANRPTTSNNQGILGYLSRPNSRTTPTSPAPATTPDKTEKPPMDQASQKGKFGWVMMGEEHLPYIQRGDEQYCAVRMVEVKLLVKYLSYLNSDIYTCTCIRSYFITESEARLLTEINVKHCEGKFGREPFTTKDLVVRKEDASEFYNFLELCYNKLVNPSCTTDSRCGFVKINNDSVVPYTVKDNERYVPLFYFEGETETLKKQSTALGAWDLAYLKFCCKVQGIRSELFANDSCLVISLTDIKAYFPTGTVFDEYWPPKPTDTALLVSNKPASRGAVGGGATASWIKVPHGSSPPATNIVAPSSNPASNGWSSMMTSSARYQPSSLPVPIQPRSSPMSYSNVTSSNSGSRSYTRSLQQSNNVNQYYTPVPHATHNSISTLPSAAQQSRVPPLVRVSSSDPSVANSSYTCSPAASTYTCTPTTVPHSSSQMLLSKSLMPPPPHVQYVASHNNNNISAQKYPSNMLPVNGSASRYYGASGDVIDLSSPPHSPQRSLALMNGKQVPQPAHQTSRQPQPAKSPVDSSGWNRLIPITESPARQSNHCPFKMQKALVSGKMVPCINAKPYVYSELLMTVNDLMDFFFPGVSLAKCREVLQNVLQITLYSGNLAQKSVLRDNNKCKTLTEVLPLIQLKDVMQYMPQLKYILERNMTSSGESAPKRARIS